jgi:hypothetical protein
MAPGELEQERGGLNWTLAMNSLEIYIHRFIFALSTNQLAAVLHSCADMIFFNLHLTRTIVPLILMGIWENHSFSFHQCHMFLSTLNFIFWDPYTHYFNTSLPPFTCFITLTMLVMICFDVLTFWIKKVASSPHSTCNLCTALKGVYILEAMINIETYWQQCFLAKKKENLREKNWEICMDWSCVFSVYEDYIDKNANREKVIRVWNTWKTIYTN